MTCDLKSQAKAIDNIERAKTTLLKAGYGIIDPSYMSLLRQGNIATLNFGFKIPRPMTLLIKLVGLSPGEIKLWHDADSGWFTEARAKPGATPVYKHVSDEVAVAILKKEVTHELEAELLTPDKYIDN